MTKRKRNRRAGERLPLSGLQPIARAGDLVNNGQFVVCRVDCSKGDIYDDTGRKLELWEYETYDRQRYTDQREPVQYKGVRDWMSRPLNPGEFGVSTMSEWRDKAWRDCYQGNASLVREYAAGCEPSDVAYLVASGPSLERNCRHLRNVRRGKIVAVNWTLPFLQVAGMGKDVADYFVCIDFKMHPRDHWSLSYGVDPAEWGPYPRTTGVFDVTVNPEVSHLGFRETRWFVSGGGARYAVFDDIRAAHPGITCYDSGLNVTFSALQFCSMALRCKTLVLVGCDCALTWGHHHAGTWAKYDDVPPYDYMVRKDIYGVPVVVTKLLAEIRDWTVASLYFLHGRHGIRVINATEGGIIDEHCEIRTLAETVDELNER